ncbi:hypothetical protein [Cellulomonas edaphi]|uniref:DUF1905 domain-containing protein n=1 Tax=Cellulomonas edaphi TaxID=3053468 RepID=A0ABT7S2P7_9CELL|nr:hypothetical protein [Cellulomons edaphi]MDM7829889.1 hypothetical protein [Cellulomons edaphi]
MESRREAGLPDCIVVVLPGPDGARAVRVVEPWLRLALRASKAEVDGTLLGRDEAEVWVYPQDTTAVAATIRRMLRLVPLPAGSHLRIKAGDDVAVVSLRR